MTVEQAVLSHLEADASVAALVGTRLYLLTLPQKPTLPAVLVSLVDDMSGHHLRGPAGTTPARVQVEAVAAAGSGVDPNAVANGLAEVIDAALDGVKFSVGSPALEVSGSFRQLRQVLYEADELRLVRVLQDYVVWSRTVN